MGDNQANGKAAASPKGDISDWVSPDLWDRYRDKFHAGDLVEFRREGKLFQHWGLYLGEGLVVHVSSFDLWNPSAALQGLTNASAASQTAVTVIAGASGANGLPGARAETPEEVIEMVELPNCDQNGCVAEKPSPVEKGNCASVCVKCEDVTIEPSPLDLGFGPEDRTKWYIKVENIIRIAGRDQFRVNNVVTRMAHRVIRTPQEIFAIVKNLKDHEVDYSLVTCNCEHFVTSLKFKQDGKVPEPADVVPVVVSGSSGSSSQVRRAVQMISMAMVAVVGLAGAAVGALLVGKAVPAVAASEIPPSSSPKKTEDTPGKPS